MKANGTVWKYYDPIHPVHPEYEPYMRYPTRDYYGNIIDINMWKEKMCEGNVNKELVRKNWGVSFQLKHPDDPAPPGWVKTVGGWCVKDQLEYEPVLYTNKAFLPKKQYFNGAYKPNRKVRNISESTDLRSMNPILGQYVIYYQPSESQTYLDYGNVGSKDSLLG